MKKFLSLFVLFFAATGLTGQDSQQPRLPEPNQFQVFSMAYGLCYGKAIELSQQKDFDYFIFREVDFEMKGGLEMEIEDKRKVKGDEIAYTFKPEEIPMLKESKLSFKIVTFKEKPTIDPPAVDINEFIEMMRSMQGSSMKVEKSNADEIASQDQPSGVEKQNTE